VSDPTPGPTPRPTSEPTAEPTAADVCGSCTGCAHVTSGGTHCHDDTEDAATWAAHATQELCESHDDDHHWCRVGSYHTELATCPEVVGYDYDAECVAPTSGPCKGSVTIDRDSDTTGFSCTVIGGDLTIQSANKNHLVTDAGLANLGSLTHVCGTVTIQKVNSATLAGLENLAYVGGSLTIQQNSYYGGASGTGPMLRSLAGLGVEYVGGSLTVQENMYLEDLGGFGPVVVGGAWSVLLYPGCPGVCTDAGAHSVFDWGLHLNCINTCTIGTSYYDIDSGAAASTSFAAECAANPYAVKTFAPTPRPTPQPTPSPVVDTGVPNCRDLCDAYYTSPPYSATTNTNPYCGGCNSATTNCFTTSCVGPWSASICTVNLAGQVCQP